MNIKEKRRNLIIGFILSGLAISSMMLFLHVKNELAQLVVLFSLAPLFCFHFFSSVLKWNELASGAMAALGQMLVYYFLGWISARLVYPKKKTASESEPK